MENPEINARISRSRERERVELEALFQFISTVIPDLRPDEVMVLTAFLLEQLPELLLLNPNLMNYLKQIAAGIKRSRVD